MILKGKVFVLLEPEELQNLGWLFIKIHGYGITVLEIFWGLWLMPLALLIYKSGFIPRIVGVLGFITGIAYITDSFTFLLFPAYRALLSPYLMVAFFGEVSIILWLLIKGVKAPSVTVETLHP